MELFLYLVTRSVDVFLSAMIWLMLIRVILDVFSDGESRFHVFCTAVTEPVIMPVRALLSRIPALDEFPIDISYMATYLILAIVQAALPVS